jgi:hypothetical protein
MLLTDGRETSLQTARVRFQTQLSIFSYWNDGFFWCDIPQWARASSFTKLLNHTQWHNRVGRTPLDEWSALRRDLYLTTHNTHNRQISTPPVGFEPTISAGERPQTSRPLGSALKGCRANLVPKGIREKCPTQDGNAFRRTATNIEPTWDVSR